MHAPSNNDGIAELVGDHRRIEHWFRQWQRDNTLLGEETLARQICAAISDHLRLDAQLFYPAYDAATHDEYRSRTELEDHVALQELIDEIEHTSATEEAFFAKVHLLCELFSQHVNREEEERGIFSRARGSGMDLNTLGAALRDRRSGSDDRAGRS